MTRMTEVLKSHGVKTKGSVPYGDPIGGGDTATMQLYQSLGFTFYPRQNGLAGYNGPDLALITQYFWLITYSNGWGYDTQWYNLGRGLMATLYPQDQEFYLSAGALTPATGGGPYAGVVIDSPGLIKEWAYLTNKVIIGVGFGKIIGGPADWLQSDHPINYGGANGQDGGHNMNTYARYVNNLYGFPVNFYLLDVSPGGAHVRDGTHCLLWALLGQQDNYTAATCKPTDLMAMDVSIYHHRVPSGGFSESTSFSQYLGATNARLEYEGILKPLQAQGQVFARTAVPLGLLANVPAYNASVLAVMADPGDCFGIMMSSGMDINATPYFNWANPSDNSSNPGVGFGVATQQTVLNFCLGLVPYLSNNDLLDTDTAPNAIPAQLAATTYAHYSQLWNKIPLGGWFGVDRNTVSALVIDHSYNVASTFSALGLVCRPWGADSYSSLADWTLSNFPVILGYPNAQDPSKDADRALVESYVSNGGTLIVHHNSGVPSTLTGIGTTAFTLPFNHPIYQPYAQADLVVGGHNGNDFINQHGKGQVVTLHSAYYGDGFGLGDSANGQGNSDSMASGLAYLTLNAIAWASGQPTPVISLPKYVQRTAWAAPFNGQGGPSGVGVHVIGYPIQCVLLSNAQASPVPVDFSLNQSLYQLPPSFQDVNTQTTVSGSEFAVTIPAQDWMVFLPTSSTTRTAKATISVKQL